jgi:hypothetical protein
MFFFLQGELHVPDLSRLVKKDLVATSGAYSYGMSRLVKDLPGGQLN